MRARNSVKFAHFCIRLATELDMIFLDGWDSISLMGPYYHERWTVFLIYSDVQIKYYEKFIKSFDDVHTILNFATT